MAAKSTPKKKTPPKRQPILKIETFTERNHVAIDGSNYQLRNGDEFSIVDSHRLSKKGERLDALTNSDELSDDDASELRALVDELCRSILIAPDSIHEKLSDIRRLQIIQVFTQLQSESLPPTGAVAKEAPTGAKSSRDSRVFTAGIQLDG